MRIDLLKYALPGTLVFCTWMTAGVPGNSASEDLAVRFEKRVYKDKEGDILPYRLLLPADLKENPDKKYPLVLFLHGLGERGIDNEAQLMDFLTLYGATDLAGIIAQFC